MKRLFRAILPPTILGLAGYAAWWLVENRPETPMKAAPPALVRVEATTLRIRTYPVRVRSQGTVQPRTRSTLLPEVPGRIVEVDPSFRPGGFFGEGDVLLKLDPVDYETAHVVAEAELARAQVVLAEEKARAAQARENWRALGKSGEPGDLALRLPQVAQAEAEVAAATARIGQAERDLDRTVIRAPYDGQVLQQLVDVGQFVTQGTPLGELFAVDYVEIRLPLPDRELPFLDLPERFRDGESRTAAGAPVTLRALLGGRPAEWSGTIVRVEGAIDDSTRQITAVAQVDDPYAKREEGQPPLRIGQFLEAEIEGRPLEGVFVIPRRAVRAGNEVLLVTPENRLRRVQVEPIVADAENVVVAPSVEAPREGDVLCLTPIPFAAEGARVLPLIDGGLESTATPRGERGKDAGTPASGAAPSS